MVSIQNSNDFNWTPPSGSYRLPNGKVLTVGPTNPSFSYGDQQYTNTTDSNGNSITTPQAALLQLTYLVSTGKAKILSNPTITALNGYAASFDVSTKRIYSIPTTTVSNGVTTTTNTNTTVDSGLYVTITPWVSDGKITMEVKPKISEYGAIPQNATIPETTEHSTETTVRVNNNEPVIISGLKSIRQSTSIAKIPILGDIPLLGLLFKSKSVEDVQEEFVIVITPKIIYDDAANTEATNKLMNHLDPSIQEEFKDDNSPADTGKKGKAKKK
ncbi:MAG TPA: hypothetical protein DDW50_08820 [Firmicutes bacterium]|nr:hypothetical protein [Bacillota bacterium]